MWWVCVWVVGASHPSVLRSCCGPVVGCRTWHCHTRCSAPALPPGKWTWWGSERRVEDSASLTPSTSQTEAPSRPDPDGPDSLQLKRRSWLAIWDRNETDSTYLIREPQRKIIFILKKKKPHNGLKYFSRSSKGYVKVKLKWELDNFHRTS